MTYTEKRLEDKQKLINEYQCFLDTLPILKDGEYKDPITDWWIEKIESLLKLKQEEIEKAMEEMRKYHREFECNGANSGRGCHEDWCEDQKCRNAPKEYNQALDDLKPIITNLLK